ncbi:MAG: LysR substrate-binding domain-containing protein [Burkholderiaceae bacterium]|nr:LysR substrate-binding domain-containing protein [Burkholderiaceae bacterium]
MTFAQIAASGGISAAAAALGLDKAAVSRQLRELEDLLDVRLMHRGAKGMVLTEVGTLVYERAQRVIHEVEHAEIEAQALRSLPRGVLTVSASVAFGKLHLVPLLADFMRLYPDIEVQLCLLDRHTDPVEEGIDVLLRLCDVPPDHLVAHHLCEMNYVVVASPSLVQSSPPIETPQDLENRSCLFYGFKTRTTTWCFRHAGETYAVPVATRVSVNSSEAVRDFALQAMGFALLPCFVIAADLRSGLLERLLPAYEVTGQLGRNLYALHLPGRSASPKIKAFVDFVRARWFPHGAWS